MGCILYPKHLWITFVGILTIVLTSDGSTITWYEPPPVQTLSDTEGHLANSTQLLQGTINASLSWNFSLSADLVFQSLTLNFGVTVIAGVQSSGQLLVLPGFKDKFDIRWIPSHQRVTLIIFNVTTEVNGAFGCTVNALKLGIVTISFTSSIQVQVVVPPAIDYLSSDLDVCENTTVILSCNATGKPTPSITWKRVADDGAVILSSVHGVYVLNNTNRNSRGQYRCTASNGVGVANKTVNVTVRFAASIDQIVNSSTTVIEGGFFNMSCQASGNPSPNYTWINEDGQLFHGSVLSFTSISRAEAGQYRCEVENRCGMDGRNTTVIVYFSPTVSISENQTVTKGGDLSLFCTAEGKPQPTTTWITPSNKSVVSGNLTLSNISGEDAGGYRCTADNGVGSPVSKDVFVDVQYPPEGIQFHVSEEEVCNGTTISFNCSAETANPMELNYQLYENNITIGVISSTGVWSKTSWTVEGVFVYKCMVNNSVGTAMSSTVSVNVNVSSFIMPISTVVITEGGNLNLSCPAFGTPSPTVFWVKTSNGEHTNGTELVIRNISRSEAGDYRCEATNPCGNASESATIDVQYPPEGIQLHLSEEEVCNGTTISFNCSAETANPMELNYQLYENNSMIAVISSTGVWNIMMTVGGVFVYKCMVNNSVGPAMSSTVFVNVNVSSSIQTISDKVVLEGDNLTLFCKPSGIPQPHVSWVNVSNEHRTDGNKLMFENITRYEAGEYRCEATNPCRNATKSTAIVVHYAAEATGRGGNYSVPEGSTKLFSCPVDGNPEPEVAWYKGTDVNGRVISNAKQLEATETGCYTCSASNLLGAKPVTITQCLTFDTFTNVLEVGFEFTKEEFKPEYENLENQETKEFIQKVEQAIKIEMNGTSLSEVLVTKLKPSDHHGSASVIADVKLTFNGSVGKRAIEDLLIEALKDKKLGDIDVGRFKSDGFISVPEEPTSTGQPEGLPWTIIGAIAGSVLLVAFVVAFVTWWVHKKRKCRKDPKIHNSECEESLHGDSPHASVNRAYAESGPPSASGSKGAAQQQSQDPGAIPTYAVVDKSKKKKKAEEKPPIYAAVDKSKKRKKKTDDKNLYDSVEEPKKEKKPGEVLYAELGDFKDPAMPQVSTSPEPLPPLRRPPSYEQTQYADITAFLKGDATLPQKEGNEGSEMQQQSANQSQHDVDNKETPIQEDSPCSRVNGAYAKSGPPSANSTDVSSAAQKQPAQEAGAIPTYAVVDKSKKKKKEPEEMPLVNTDKGKSKKKKKKTDDKNLYDSVEEPKKEKKPGEIFYADLGEFQKQEMPKVATSPPTLPPLKRAPSYEKTDYAEITQFLRKEATLPKVATSPPTLPPIKRAASYEKTDCAEITQFLEKEATLPREKTSNSEMKPQAANQTHDEVENKETAL